jgi:hypothetical protein
MPTRGHELPTLEALEASAARTASGNGQTWHNFGPAKSLRLYVHVTAASGTAPTLVVNLQDSHNGTDWVTVASTTPNITAAGVYALNVESPFGDIIRATWTIGGTTPSFTFSVHAYAQGT